MLEHVTCYIFDASLADYNNTDRNVPIVNVMNPRSSAPPPCDRVSPVCGSSIPIRYIKY